MTFEHSSYVPEGSPTLRVVIFVPHDDMSAAKVSAFVSERKPLIARRLARPN
jgi:hypothetical protein